MKLRNIVMETQYLSFASGREEIVLPFQEIPITEEELNEPFIQRKISGRRPKMIVVFD